jgi:hypothetical protein
MKGVANVEREDKKFMKVRHVSYGWNQSTLFSTHGSIGN